MSDLVTRLRRWADTIIANEVPEVAQSMTDAADEIERLREQMARLCDRGTVQALRDANDRAEAAERERDEARANARNATNAATDWRTEARKHERIADQAVALLKEVTERWLLDELCGRYRVRCNSCQELKARLDAFLAGGPK